MEELKVFRNRRYSWNGLWYSWFEECEIVKETKETVVVRSRHPPDYPVYRGGEFRLNKKALIEGGSAYTSRHGEWFYSEIPEGVINMHPSQIIG